MRNDLNNRFNQLNKPKMVNAPQGLNQVILWKMGGFYWKSDFFCPKSSFLTTL